ncbi:hypothetical protein L3Q82_024421, partial [Scortum barcoo]
HQARPKAKGCREGWVEFTCKYPTTDKKYQDIDLVLPKGKETLQSSKKDVWEKKSSRVSLYHDTTNKHLRVAIKQLGQEDFGKYTCEFYQRSPEKVELEVDITIFERSPAVGQSFTYWCKYTTGSYTNKFICKGEDPSRCELLLNSTALPSEDTGRFSMTEDTANKNITITVRDVRTDDTGTYWCGAKSSKTPRNKFFHRFLMTVGESCCFIVQTLIEGGVTKRRPRLLFLRLVQVPRPLNVMMRRQDFHVQKTPRTKEHQSTSKRITSTRRYRMRVQKPDSGNAMKTIYATANFPSDPSASLHYSTINFQSGSDKAGGEELLVKPSSSACEYSAVKKSPTYWTVHQPSRSSEGPLYSTVNRSQQQMCGKKRAAEFPFTMIQANKHLRVAIRQLGQEDFDDYKCEFYQRSVSSPETEEVELEVETDDCQRQFIQTAYKPAQTTITCDFSGNKSSSVQFFCKDNGFICEDILSTESSLKSNGTFSLTETSRGFSVSISNVSSHHAAVYWCGVKPKAGSYRAALRKIQLEVEDITTFKRSPAVGQNFYILDDKKRNLTITVRGVTADDTGTYWCGAESSDEGRSNKFFCRLLMTVDQTSVLFCVVALSLDVLLLVLGITAYFVYIISPTSSTPPVSSTQSTTALTQSRETDDCQRQFIQTAYKPAQTTITCDFSGNKSSSVQFFCKDNGFICEDILSTESSLKSNGTFSLTETSRGFSVSISNVSSHHAAVYWCGVKPKAGSYRAALRKIQLEVEDIKTFKTSPAVGQNFTYWCEYPNGAFIKKIILNETTTTPSIISTTSPDPVATSSSTPSTAAETDDGSWLTYRRLLAIIVSSVVCVAMLVLVLVLVFIYRRHQARPKAKGCREGWVEFTCKYPGTNGKYQDIDLVLPKGKETLRSSKKDVWEKKSSRVSLYHDTTNKHLRVAIRQLGQEDFEKYTCKFYQRSPEKVELEVETDCQRQFIQTAYKPAQTTITCDYSGNKNSSVQFFCKENGFICEDILSTESSLKSNGTFSLTETSRGFSVSISNVSSHHAAVYWCGVKPKAGSYRAALRKIQLEVEISPTSSTPPVSSTQSTTALAESRAGLSCRRLSARRHRDRLCSCAAAPLCAHFDPRLQHDYYFLKTQETEQQHEASKRLCFFIPLWKDHVYEEIQDGAQKPDSGNAMKTIHTATNFPSDPSASLHYSTINFQSGSDKAGGEALLVKPSSSACEYSAVKKSPTYWTVHQPSRSSEGPLYSTVNRPQQQ